MNRSPQTTADWLECLREAAPALRQRKWVFMARRARYGLIIRSEGQQCVLCCLAEIMTPSAGGYSEAWRMALGKAFDPTAVLSEARPIALASDRMSAKGPIQAALCSILGVTL